MEGFGLKLGADIIVLLKINSNRFDDAFTVLISLG